MMGTCDLPIPIFTKFLKVAQEYLKVSSVATKRLLRVIGDGKDGVFCGNCEVTVISPICQVYSQLLCARASLSVELEKLQVVLEDSTESSLDKVKLESTPSLVVHNAKLSYFKPFRSSLSEKCQQKRSEFLPRVIVQRLIVTPTAPGVTPKKEPDVFDDFQDELDDADTFEPFDDDDDLHHSPRDSFAEASREDGPTDLNGEEFLLKREVIQEPELAIKIENVEQRDDSTLEPVLKKPRRKGRKLLTKPNRLKCSSCSKLLLNEEQLKLHNRNYHEPTNCSSCGQTFSGESLFNRHWARVHSTKGKIPCPSCPKVFRKLDSLTRHRKYAHGGDSESFPCPTCSRVFPTALRLLCHRNAHSSRVYPCDHCAMSFKSRTPLLYHLSLFHKSVATVFPCPHCIIVFKHEQNLKSHVRKRHSLTSPKPVVKRESESH
ncbi:putative zinc finger protein [Orchesella cincta]|uniref:Putative zinc finger protein n=1 Tax=Orchesella cincta TaxID=48709 RepID=A0A1D2M411_ORCCI|nr:putative zinc finger protein [Orchesella cincta]